MADLVASPGEEILPDGREGWVKGSCSPWEGRAVVKGGDGP